MRPGTYLSAGVGRFVAGVHGDALHDLSGAGAMTDDVSEDPLNGSTHARMLCRAPHGSKVWSLWMPFLRMPPRLPKVAIR
jgi:hypothetical protein